MQGHTAYGEGKAARGAAAYLRLSGIRGIGGWGGGSGVLGGSGGGLLSPYEHQSV